MELRVDLADGAADDEEPGPEVEVRDAQLGKLAPPQPGLHGRLDEETGEVVGGRGVDLLELLRVMIRYSFTGTVGVLMPFTGWYGMSRSLTAVVKIVDRMIRTCRIVAGETPRSTIHVTHSRTSGAVTSRSFIAPKYGMRWRLIA